MTEHKALTSIQHRNSAPVLEIIDCKREDKHLKEICQNQSPQTDWGTAVQWSEPGVTYARSASACRGRGSVNPENGPNFGDGLGTTRWCPNRASETGAVLRDQIAQPCAIGAAGLDTTRPAVVPLLLSLASRWSSRWSLALGHPVILPLALPLFLPLGLPLGNAWWLGTLAVPAHAQQIETCPDCHVSGPARRT